SAREWGQRNDRYIPLPRFPIAPVRTLPLAEAGPNPGMGKGHFLLWRSQISLLSATCIWVHVLYTKHLPLKSRGISKLRGTHAGIVLRRQAKPQLNADVIKQKIER